MKKILLLAVIIAGNSLIATNDNEGYAFNSRKDLVDTGIAAVATPVSTFGLLTLDCFFGTSLLFTGGTDLFLYAGNIAPIIGSQITTVLAAKTISNSIVKRATHLDRNLALNVVEAAF
jgi:hypothetical protein